MITATLVGDRELISKLDAMPAKIRDALQRNMTILAMQLEAKVKGEKLSGQVLHVRTGALRRSIFHQVDVQASSVVAKVASAGDVKYAAIHEYGGTTPPHIIEPRKAQALAFMSGGKMVFARRVNHPGSRMPERSFLRSSLKEMEPVIRAGIEEAVKHAAALR